MQKRRLLLAMLLCAFWLTGFAQNAVKGTVKDKSGEPLIGVSVTYGSGQGTVTDIDGNFSVNVPAGSTIKFSYVGYKPQSMKASGNMSITLEEDNTTLEDVVVVGYGTMKRRDLTGAVASVSGDKLAANPVANVAQALQGQLPGVSVMSQDGRPGASMNIRVRGGGSISQSNDPLYIVDGVQVSDISDIPADNIESIDVLKDAASTAIYGARGANGVILVTTKGSKGDSKATVKYNMYYQIKKLANKLDVLNAYDYVLNQWSYATAYNPAGEGDQIAKFYGLGNAYGNHLDEYRNMGVHDYVDDLTQTAHAWNHDISVTGGNQNTKYFATVNYTNDEGNRINTSFKRWSANFKISQKITKNLTFDADLRYSELNFEGDKFDYATGSKVYGYAPVTPLGDGDISNLGLGSSSYDNLYNPVDYVNNYTKTTKRNRIRGIGGLTWNIIDGLTAKTELSLSRNWNETRSWDAGANSGYNKAVLSKSDGYGTRWATTLNYQVKGLGEDHELSFLVGNEILSSKTTSSSTMTAAGFPSGFTMEEAFSLFTMYNIETNSYDTALKQINMTNTTGHPNHTTSWFGRVNYNYLGRYLLTATFRADGSSKFAPNNHWGYFPAAAAAWRISDEPFMESAKDWLDNLKLRLSFGTSGNDDIDASLWKEFWVPSVDWSTGKRTITYSPSENLANPDLKWETTTSRNLGLDFGFWNGKLRGSIEAYWNSTKDILMRVPVDATSGHDYQYQNVGETSNKGIELSVFYEIYRSKDFNVSVNATYNYNKSNVDKIAEGVNADVWTKDWGSTLKQPHYDYILREGSPVGTIQGFKDASFYTVDDFDVVNGVWTLKPGVPDINEVINYAPGALNAYNRPAGQNAIPGMIKFADVNGDGKLDLSDATDIGHVFAEHTGGFNINANYKGIDFAAGFTYQIGGKVYNANAMHSWKGDKNNELGWNRLAYTADVWKMYSIDGNGDLVAVTDPDQLRAMNAGAQYAMPFNEYGLVLDTFVEDASYLRLNTLTLGYTIPKVWTKKVGISNLRVYFTGGNLFCLSGYNGLDPDVNSKNSGQDGYQTPGYDWNSYPRARTYTFGLNVTF